MSSITVASRYTAASPSAYAGDYRGRNCMSSPLAPPASGARSSPTPSSPLSSVGSSSVKAVNRAQAVRGSASSSSSRTLKPGPLGLGGSRNAAIDIESGSTLARLRRQQFRQKCQEAMARDRTRDRNRRVAQGRVAKEGGSSDSEGVANDTDASLLLRSDDLSSSDMEEEEEMEYIRRVLAVDYRRMLREQGRSGQIEVGWLDPDEVAWLEEEVKREEAILLSQDVEPPADLADEDEELYAQYQHSQHLRIIEDREDDSLDYGDDDYWLNNEEWQRAIDGVEQTLAKTNEDTLMSED